MATGHWLTNKGKKYLIDGGWTDAAGTDIKVGLLQTSQPAAADTQIEVADLDFVSSLLVTAGATEANFTNYGGRVALTRSAAAEDDTNDRVNMDASDVVWTSAGGATNNTLYGAFILDDTGGADTSKILISVDWFASTITTNGGNFTYAIADLYRAS